MKKALGIGGFPHEITLNRIGKKEVPAVPFDENTVSRLNEEIKIFVTPNQHFNAKFRGMFSATKIQHTSGAKSKRWLAGPNMSYRPRQLTFAVWCTTTGRGISRAVFDKVSSTDQVISDVSHPYHRQKDFLCDGLNRLFQVTQLSAKLIIIMTSHRSNEYVQNLDFC